MSSRGTEILAALLADGGDDGLPERLTAACADVLPETGVGLVLRTGDGPVATVAASGEQVALMEELQFTLGEGPCVTAVATRRPVLEADLARSGPPRWPAFTAGALDAGIRAVFALPLLIGTVRLGSFALYRKRAGPLSDHAFAEALSFADVATAVLLHLRAHRADGPMRLIEDRAEVHQATGVVSVRAGVPLEQALVLLRARAFATDRPVSAVARDVLSGVLEIPGDEGPARGH